ncbi:hypothetical protein MHYP_G00217970 [Metynnis hypsauchen]
MFDFNLQSRSPAIAPISASLAVRISEICRGNVASHSRLCLTERLKPDAVQLPRIQPTGLQLTLDSERPACERHGDLEPAYRSRSIHSPTPPSLPITHTALDEAETSGEEKRERRERLCLAGNL